MAALNCGRWTALGVLIALSAPFCSHPAKAVQDWNSYAAALSARAQAMRTHSVGTAAAGQRYSATRSRQGGGALQCVPFARANSGIELVGNAVNWWGKAAGVYERGSRPEVGSVLNFRATGRMNLGHVAVVSRIMDSRTVEIDHANWSSRGAISRNISVVDVSPNNDWTAVRVELGQTGEYGSVYPTYGFIYDRPDRGVMVANAAPTNPAATAVGAEPRPANERVVASLAATPDVEVAEAAGDPQPSMRRVFYGHAPRSVRPRPVVVIRGAQGHNGRPYF